MIHNITAIILAGGESSRMGEDKAFIRFSGRPLIEIIIDTLSGIFGDVKIITNKPGSYEQYGIKTYTDIVKDRGPLGGLYTGLRFSRNNYNFVVACDMPFLNENLIKFMSEKTSGYDVIIPERRGRLEPLCAIYSKECIRPIETVIQENRLKIRDIFEYVKVKIIPEEEIAKFDLRGRCFVNLNSPEDKKEVECERT